MLLTSDLRLKKNHKLAVLTGAGISAESGIKTFRDADGLWENHPVEEVATPEGFYANPSLVWKFYRERFIQAGEVKPNAGHYALKDLECYLTDNFLLITQNVDGLHRAAGSERLIEMHGSLQNAFCIGCKKQFPMAEVVYTKPIPLCTGCGAMLRPDIVWFGEMPYQMEKIYDFLEKVDYFLVCGTSGFVYPAAGFLQAAKHYGAETIGVNLEAPQNLHYIDHFHQGSSGEILPGLVSEWFAD